MHFMRFHLVAIFLILLMAFSLMLGMIMMGAHISNGTVALVAVPMCLAGASVVYRLGK